MPDTLLRKVTIFVSSPNDVAPERGRVQAVAAELNRKYEGLVRFETVLWEEHFYTADKSFQPQIQEAVATDIVVSIFWTRIGTELPVDFHRMPNGKPYPSGTAYELLTALEGSKAKGVPDVYVFRKTADATLPMADPERRRQAQTQLEALEAFWSEWFRSEKGEFKAAFQNFPSTDSFEQQFELLLRQWLETRGFLGPRIAWPKEKGSPFRGLAPFEAEHAAVFFGRARVIDEARRRLAEAAERGCPFLLIVGASGSGKSSLARAGLIPRLTTPGVVTSVDLWRVARMKPGEGQAGPLMAMATALLAPEALPELSHGDYPTSASLADNLRRGGTASVQPITSALGRVAEDSQRARRTDQAPKSALVLLVDQFEELFAQRVSDAERAAFAESLRQLIATGRVWAVATLRADLYELLLKQPPLKALKEIGASLDLGPPGPAELAEIVRAPAAAAGLVFETNAEKGELGERLLADAKSADSLPLLQFTLRQLYERREEIAGETRLTHAAYDQLGGLAGAIAAEAERAASSLAPDAVATLPRLLRRLAEPARDGKALTLREVLHAEVATEPSEATLVDALLMARILIARTDANGRPTVRLAHDAVLAAWPRAREAAQASREFYRVRAEVEAGLRLWQEYGRPKDRLIQPGVPLAEAEKLVADFPAELPAELTRYVTASRNRARRRQRLVAAAAVILAVISVAAVLGWHEARVQQALAEAAQKGAEASLAVANSRSDLRDGRVASAIDNAAKAFKKLPTETSRSALTSALLELSPHLERTFDVAADGVEAIAWISSDTVVFAPAAGGQLRTLMLSKPDSGKVTGGLPLPELTRVQDGNRATVRAIRIIDSDLVAVLDNGALAVTKRGATSSQVRASPQPVTLYQTAQAAAISRSGSLVAIANNGADVGLIKCTSLAGADISSVCENTPLMNVRGKVVAINRNETRVAVGDEAGEVVIYDRSGNRVGQPISVGGTLLSLEWANARDWLAVGNHEGDIVVIDPAAPAGPPIAKASVAGSPITTLAWSPARLDLAFSCQNGTICVWPGAAGLSGAARFAPIRHFHGHTSAVTQLAWSPGGDRIASASTDGTIRVWSVAQNTDAVWALYAEVSAQFTKVASSPDGRWVAGGAKDGTIAIWNARSGTLLRTVKSSAASEVASLAWARSGALAAAHESGGITLVSTDTQEPREIRIETDLDTRIVFAEDDKTIAMPQHSDKRILLLDLATSDVAPRRYLPPVGSDQVPWGLAADPSGKTLFASYTNANGEIRIWDLTNLQSLGAMAYVLPEKLDPIAGSSLSVTSDGRWLATSGGDNYVRVYDVARKRSWRALSMDPGSSEPSTVAFSPDGTKLAALAADKRVYVWSLREDGAERDSVFKAAPKRTAVADADTREQLANWLAWVTSDSIAVATGASAINVIGLDPAKWQRRIDDLAPLMTSTVK
jgi:WD40 repeat protein